jgi:hypothetical protein
MFTRIARFLFRLMNRILNRFGVLLSKPEVIHGSPAFSGACLWARRLNSMKYFFDLIGGVEGDIVESGVHWGYGILIELTLSSETDRKIFGFDSFAGHSRPHANDLRGAKWRPLDSSFKVSEQDVWRTLQLGTGKDQDQLAARVELIHGWVQDTMPEFERRARAEDLKIALVVSDCDIYEPIKATLRGTWAALQEGGIIIVGQLNSQELMGKTAAVNEFLQEIGPDAVELRAMECLDIGLEKKQQSYLVKRQPRKIEIGLQ